MSTWSNRSFPGKAGGEASRESLSGCLQLLWACKLPRNELLTLAEQFSVYKDLGLQGHVW